MREGGSVLQNTCSILKYADSRAAPMRPMMLPPTPMAAGCGAAARKNWGGAAVSV